MTRERILFVTGRLAEHSLRRMLEPLSRSVGFDYDVAVMGISVAALMQADWLLRKLPPVAGFDRVILPGWCRGDLRPLNEKFGAPFTLGPKDLHDLDVHFGRQAADSKSDLSRYDIEILAEINYAPRLSRAQVLQMAARYRDCGADVIDLGCVPGESWREARDVVRMLRDEGFRISIDSFERREVEEAVAGGAELVLSCNGSNREWAGDLEAELVVIPDDPRGPGAFDEMEETMAFLSDRGVRFRLDPVLEPIGFGFAASLARYFHCRRRWPAHNVMMGVGNLTELTEVDSAGINLLLAGICQELGIRSVLTTEVINWAKSSVRELDLARRLVHHSIGQSVLPKHVEAGLVMLRDTRVRSFTGEEIDRLASQITDPNFRILIEGDTIHLLNRDGHWCGADPFELFDRVVRESGAVDPQHAFYLGYELAKAVTALTLGKQYTQDQPLSWGYLTVPEPSAHERRRSSGETQRNGNGEDTA